VTNIKYDVSKKVKQLKTDLNMVYIQNFQAWNKDVNTKKYILKPASLE